MDGAKTDSKDNGDNQADSVCDAQDADDKDWPVDTGWAWVILLGKMICNLIHLLSYRRHLRYESISYSLVNATTR